MALSRIKKLQKNIKNPQLIRNDEDLFYFLGHNLSDGGFLFISKSKIVLFGGFLEQFAGFKSDSLRNIAEYVEGNKVIDVDDKISVAELKYIQELIPKVKLIPVRSPGKDMRLIKDSDELVKMQKAYVITAKAFADTKQALSRKKVWSEITLAQFIRLKGLEYGADDISFPVIVASGANAAVPHHTPTKKIIKKGENVILDFGFKVDGYCSDFTRTVFLKTVPPRLAEIYDATDEAYQDAIKKVRQGATGQEVDAAARTYLESKGLGEYFIHSVGHGTGLRVHEAPALHQHSEDVLKNGMVFSIEPGVYIPKLGGVRIEDLVYLEKGQVKYFKKVSTNLKDMIV